MKILILVVIILVIIATIGFICVYFTAYYEKLVKCKNCGRSGYRDDSCGGFRVNIICDNCGIINSYEW
jgi:hypothetical protein